ncbi:MAG: spore coat associated protein CotJA [Lachnospiraceae bacterium]|nr:spore coat associated protein CotJA [Lachnospiraceae bacterium]
MAQQTQTASSCPMPYSTMDMDRFPVAMLYVPWQKWNQTYELDRGLKAGTIFPELDKPFRGIRKGGCMK